jgi:cytochrome c oxidase subunit 1
MFTIGGLSGVTHAVVPSDTQQTDTYYIVAHFHYVLFGGSIFGLFAGLYYWYPKLTGRLLSDRIGKLHFWLTLLGFNLTFAPFHVLGLQGMPRRIYTYPTGRGWDVWNFVATIGSFLIALSVLVFIYNLWVSRKGPYVGDDPWDARTLEWTIPSPPPEYNFKDVPIVLARDDFWHQKYTEDENGRAVLRERALPADAKVSPQAEATDEVEHSTDVAITEGDGVDVHDGADHDDGHDAHEEHVHIHLPSPSYWPMFSAIGLAVICYGMIYKFWVVAVLGGVWLLGGIYSWGLEPATAPEPPEEPNGDHAEPAPDDEPSEDLQPAGQA